MVVYNPDRDYIVFSPISEIFTFGGNAPVFQNAKKLKRPITDHASVLKPQKPETL